MGGACVTVCQVNIFTPQHIFEIQWLLKSFGVFSCNHSAEPDTLSYVTSLAERVEQGL